MCAGFGTVRLLVTATRSVSVRSCSSFPLLLTLLFVRTIIGICIIIHHPYLLCLIFTTKQIIVITPRVSIRLFIVSIRLSLSVVWYLSSSLYVPFRSCSCSSSSSSFSSYDYSYSYSPLFCNRGIDT